MCYGLEPLNPFLSHSCDFEKGKDNRKTDKTRRLKIYGVLEA